MYAMNFLPQVVWLTLGLAAAIFSLDLLSPLGSGEWILYLLPVIFACRTKRHVYPFLFAVICTELIILGLFLGVSDVDSKSEFASRAFGIFILWITTVLLYVNQRSTEAVSEREEFFRLISDSMTDMVAVIDENGVRSYNSPSYKKVLGDPSKLVGTDSFGEIHPDDKPMVQRIFQETLATGKGQRAQYRFQLKDGSLRYIESQGNLMQTDGVRKVVVVSRDMTERVHMENQLRQSQKMEAIGQLAGGVAHDFNNLISIVHGYAQQLLNRKDLDAPAIQAIREIDGVAERAAHLTRQLLTFSRTQAAEFRQLHLDEVLLNVAKILERLLGDAVKLQLKPATQLPCLNGDLGMIEQVIMNLAINARDAMPQGGNLEIRTSSRQVDAAYVARRPDAAVGQYVVLEVADTGTGMDQATLARIFEPFFTTKPAGKGTGLGLATVYGIIQKHKGWIDVESQPGKGTTFYVYFPAIVQTEAAATKESSSQQVSGGAETILLVEDEPILRELVEVMIQEYGYRVLPAGDANEALAIWKERREDVDLLLTDIVLPNGLGGRDLAKRLRDERNGLKVIFTSGYPPDVVRKDFSNFAEVQFIQKPYQGATLARVLRQTLDTHASP